MKYITLFLVLIVSQLISAQIEDAWVFFEDKENVKQSILNPITILSQEALDRKAQHSIVIDYRDVPVNEGYISQIKNQPGITVFAKSKWMNCIYIRGSVFDINNLLALPFVAQVEFADKSMNFIGSVVHREDKLISPEIQSKQLVYGQAANQIEMLEGDYLHDQGYTGAGMRIAIMDSGFPGVGTQDGFAYVRDDGRILGTYDFIDRNVAINNNNSHGTLTFSTIGGYITNLYAGTAPDASFYLFKTEDVTNETPVEEAYWVEAVERADSLGVHVINTSLGYRAYDNPAYSHSYQDLDGNTTFSARGANIGFEKGLLMVSSAGNSGNSIFPWVSTPADSPGILTVGAVDAGVNYASFSSVGPTVDGRIKPDIMAQGLAAAVIDQNNDIVTVSGTSFSSPITAGLVACLWQAAPHLTNAQIMQLVRKSAHLYKNPTDQMGYGIPNFQIALANAPLSTVEQDINAFTVFPNPVSEILYINFPETVNKVHVQVYNLLGSLVHEETVYSTDSQLHIPHLKSGIYLLQLQAENKSQTLKIIKK